MRRIFNPIEYQRRPDFSAPFEKAAEVLLQRNLPLDGAAHHNRIHRVLLEVIGAIQAEHTPVEEDLRRRADALHHPQQSREGAPQILFHGSRITKQESEKAALEFRIAAWLYMDRVRRPKMKVNAALRNLYRELGSSAIDALYDLGDDESIDLAGYIENRLKETD